MIRLSVSALRWRDLPGSLWPARGAAVELRLQLAAALGQPADALWLTGAGRSALHAVVQATRRSARDEALLPGYTCVVVPNVFLHLGQPVRYVDLPAGGLNPSLAAWEAAIGPSTRWVVVPHNFGQASDAVAELRRRHPQVLVIEDVAHAWGGTQPDGARLGTQGHAAFFSFEYSKCLSTGLGGALLVNDPALRPAVAGVLAAQHALPGRAQVKVLLTLAYHLAQASWPAPLAAALTALARAPSRALGLVAATQASELSGASQPDYLQALPDRLARLALPQLRRMPQVLALRRAQVRRYDEVLAGSPWLQPLAPAEAAGPPPTLLRYPLAVRHPAQRPALREGLRHLGIEPGEWFDDVVHPAGSLRHGYTAGQCPNGEWLAQCIVNLPLGLHARLSPRQWQGLRRLAMNPPPMAVPALPGDQPAPPGPPAGPAA